MRRRPVLALGLLLATGCRNPFAPTADISLVSLNPMTIMVRREPLLANRNTGYYGNLTAQAFFLAKNKVGAEITGITIVYTDLAGNLVTTYRTTGGRTFKVLDRIAPKLDKGSLSDGIGAGSTIEIGVVDNNVYDELDNQVGTTKTIVAHLTLTGEDDNGVDLTFSGDITIIGTGWN